MATVSSVNATGVLGSPVPNGAVPLRHEVRDLQANFPEQWNLYLLALQTLQGIDEESLTSYYQLAGIHGEPYKPWNNVEGIPNWSGFGGYCTHSSTIFLPWHRPYLALFEQILYGIVQDTANQYSGADKANYVNAAKDFRIPYFDWAAMPASGTSNLPSVFSQSQIAVVGLDGNPTQIDNPLFSFNFHPLNPSEGDFDSSWDTIPATVRYPDDNGNSDNDAVATAIANESAALRKSVSIVLLSFDYYNGFSNNRWLQNEKPGQYGSLENIHDNLHGVIGGVGGHMGDLAVSAFDPIFWLHHCNVDRLWSLWDAINVTSYVEPGTAGVGSFTTERDATEDINTLLKPFYTVSGTDFWTAAGVKESTTFNYAYKETQKWLFPDTASYTTSVKQAIVKQYGGGNPFKSSPAIKSLLSKPPGSALPLQSFVQMPTVAAPLNIGNNPGPATPLPATTGPAAHNVPEPVSAALASGISALSVDPAVNSAAAPPPEALLKLAASNNYTEYIANLRALKHGLNQSFTVFVFLGNVSQDAKAWPFEPNMVGRFAVLGRAAHNSCGKCATDAANDLVITGTVPLTDAIVQDITDGKLANLESGIVVPYLVENLHWRVVGFDGVEIPRDQVPELKVSVCSTVVHVGHDGIPTYDGEWSTHVAVTDGRPGGLGNGDRI